MEDRCICCGAVIPEGRQICPQCEVKKCGFEDMDCTRNPYRYEQKE